MTREQAIEVLGMVEAHGGIVIEAKSMAIEALKFQGKAEVVISQLREDRDRLLTLVDAKHCEDAVSRRKAIEKIHWLGLDNDTAIKCGLAIRALPSVNPISRWIPISERLPEKDVYVLATTEWGAVTVAEMYSADEWFIHEGATNAETDEITAWMPLPEPYKAESEG